MKAIVFSDVHANIYALEAIWAAEKSADLILCCGDLVDYGPYPREVIAWVREHNVQCVQGNHDAWVPVQYHMGNTLDAVPAEEATWAHLNAGLLREDEVQFLESLPRTRSFEMDGIIYGMTHMYRDYNEIVSRHAFTSFCAEAFMPPDARPITRLLMGHTHRQSVRCLSDELLWLNPGSASYRRRDDPDQAANYATIIDGKISLKQAPYDITPLYHFLQRTRLKESELEAVRFCYSPRQKGVL